jgi:protein SCO1/2
VNKPAQKIEWLVWSGLVLTIAVIGVAFAFSRLRAQTIPLPVIGQLPEFHLTNQDNQPITLASLRGQVWVADIIFSRCPASCATMTRRLAELQSALPKNSAVRLVSFTSDPEYDTPDILKKFALRFGADSNRWQFVTGNKPEIRGLAVNDFKFVVMETKPADRTVPDDLFIHSTYYVLVDQQGRVRGWNDKEGSLHAYFESTEPDSVAQLLPAIKQLLREPAPPK